MTAKIGVAVEETAKRSFASAVDWPGLSRSGRTVAAAVEALGAAIDRYAVVAAAAGEPFPTGDVAVDVVETNPGNGGTEFGAPMVVADADRRPTSAADGERLARLVGAAWSAFDATAAAAPGELRKGPRGGGRDTSKIVEHVLGADHAYARAMGLRVPAPRAGDRAAIDDLRAAVLDVLRAPSDGPPRTSRWTVRYAAQRIAWHALDHAWEIEDRSTPAAR
ncbi:MAG: hypothetical protein HY264_03430 [Chloroflexi bacterium]|nr:hypothetical protein [Chloroflexota bacterium]